MYICNITGRGFFFSRDQWAIRDPLHYLNKSIPPGQGRIPKSDPGNSDASGRIRATSSRNYTSLRTISQCTEEFYVI